MGGIDMLKEMFNGESLTKFIEDNTQFKVLPIHYLLVELIAFH